MNTLQDIAVLADTYKDFLDPEYDWNGNEWVRVGDSGVTLTYEDGKKVYALLLEVASLPHRHKIIKSNPDLFDAGWKEEAEFWANEEVA